MSNTKYQTFAKSLKIILNTTHHIGKEKTISELDHQHIHLMESKESGDIKSNVKYIEKVKEKETYFEIENISVVEQYNEYILTSLRTIWGINHDYLKSNFDEKIILTFKNSVKKWLDTKDVIKKKGNYHLTNKGMIIADSVSSDLFFIQNS